MASPSCLNCGGAATCSCYVSGSGLVVVTGVGTNASPYTATVSCAAIRACVGPMLAGIGFGSNFGAGGADGDPLQANGSGLSSFRAP